MPFTQPLVASPPLPTSPPLSSSSPAATLAVGLGVSGADDALGTVHADDAVAKADVTSPLELTHFVDTLLNDLEARFDSMSADVLSRLSSLSTRVDSLETSLADLMSGSALPTAAAAVKVNGVEA